MLRRLNQIRRDSPELQHLAGTVFHETDNPSLICYSRRLESESDAQPPESASPSAGSAILVVVNLDAHHRQDGWLSLDLKALGAGDSGRFQVHDLIGDARYRGAAARGFVSLRPAGHARPYLSRSSPRAQRAHLRVLQ